MSNLVCPNCNYQAEDDEQFCSKCGTKLEPAPASVSSKNTTPSPPCSSPAPERRSADRVARHAIHRLPPKSTGIFSTFLWIAIAIGALLWFFGPQDCQLWRAAHITPPLAYGRRDSARRGIVVQITNNGAEPLACIIYAISADGKKRSQKYYCTIKFGKTEEIGYLELDGWYLDPGEKLIISTSGYLCDMVVTWDEKHLYRERKLFSN